MSDDGLRSSCIDHIQCSQDAMLYIPVVNICVGMKRL